jgi:hypothetical protein
MRDAPRILVVPSEDIFPKTEKTRGAHKEKAESGMFLRDLGESSEHLCLRVGPLRIYIFEECTSYFGC